MIQSVSEKKPPKSPMHSLPAEQGVLGCCLLDPQSVDQVDLPVEAFHDLRHREIFTQLRKLWEKFRALDLITVQAALKKRGLLDQVGGITYLSECQDSVPSAANLAYYTDIVRDHYKRRRLAETCAKLQQMASDTPLDDLLFVAQSDLADVLTDQRHTDGDCFSWGDLVGFDTQTDANNVIGVVDGKTTRYLCRGQSAWLIGPSGVGKSSLALLFGAAWAIGRPVFGIQPSRAFRVLIIQAENDLGDIAEMARGIAAGLGIVFGDESESALEANIRIRTIRGKIGQQFCARLRQEIEAWRAEIVIVDPLLSFAGIDVSRQDQVSQFCRLWLDPILYETGIVLIGVHHTGKPPRQDNKQAPQTLTDIAYAGIGSSELVNWARAVIVLQVAGDGAFRLNLAKRGKRAGAVHPSGEPTQVLWLRHAQDGKIFWDQIEPQQEEPREKKGRAGQPSKIDRIMDAGLGLLIDKLTEPVGKNKLADMIIQHVASQFGEVSRSTAKSIVDRLMTNKAIKYDGAGYSKA